MLHGVAKERKIANVFSPSPRFLQTFVWNEARGYRFEEGSVPEKRPRGNARAFRAKRQVLARTATRLTSSRFRFRLLFWCTVKKVTNGRVRDVARNLRLLVCTLLILKAYLRAVDNFSQADARCAEGSVVDAPIPRAFDERTESGFVYNSTRLYTLLL